MTTSVTITVSAGYLNMHGAFVTHGLCVDNTTTAAVASTAGDHFEDGCFVCFPSFLFSLTAHQMADTGRIFEQGIRRFEGKNSLWGERMHCRRL